MNASAYLKSVIHEFGRLQTAANKAIEQLKPEQFFTLLHQDSNSVAILMKHLAGNMKSRWTDFLTTDGEKPDRNRDQEFEIHNEDTPGTLADEWQIGWNCLFNTISSLDPSQIESKVFIRKEELTVMEAINRQLAHYGQHVGQIIYLSKLLAGSSWKTLSIPKGGSRRFNENPKPYKNGSHDE
jgi:hypothetical protein